MFRTSGFVGEPATTAALTRPSPGALVQVIATITLALSTLVAASAVSIGIARANTPSTIASLLGW